MTLAERMHALRQELEASPQGCLLSAAEAKTVLEIIRDNLNLRYRAEHLERLQREHGWAEDSMRDTRERLAQYDSHGYQGNR